MTLSLAVYVSHPIQYEIPVYRKLADRPGVELTVYFGSDHNLDAWDIDLLGGYDWVFLTRERGGPIETSRGLIEHLRRDRPDAILINGWAHLSHFVASFFTGLSGVPIIVRGDSNRYGPEQFGPAVSAAQNITLRAWFRTIDAFATIGTANRDFYRALGVPVSKLFHAPLVVDNDWFRKQAAAMPSPTQLKTERGIDAEQPVVLFVGNLIERKRPCLLTRAFCRATSPGEASLCFVGKGEQRMSIEREAKALNRWEDVHLTGFVEQSELPSYYKMADIFCLPSAREPWGLVINEAMALGLPVVATEVVGAAIDLVDGSNGYTVPVECEEALVKSLQSLIRDESMRERMGDVSAKRIDQWDAARAADGILNAANNVAKF